MCADLRDKLIPNVEYNEADNPYTKVLTVLNGFKSKVKPSTELSKRFKEFYNNQSNRAVFCGVCLMF